MTFLPWFCLLFWLNSRQTSQHGGVGVWMSFLYIFLWGHWHLVNSVLDVLHISIYVKPHRVIKALLSFMFTCTRTHTQKHNGPHQTLNCTTSLQIFEDSLLSSVLWIYSTVTDLAKFLGKSTWKKHQRSKYSWFVLLGFLMQKIPDKF